MYGTQKYEMNHSDRQIDLWSIPLCVTWGTVWEDLNSSKSIRKFIQNDVALKFSNIWVCMAISIAKYAILTQEVEWELWQAITGLTLSSFKVRRLSPPKKKTIAAIGGIEGLFGC